MRIFLATLENKYKYFERGNFKVRNAFISFYYFKSMDSEQTSEMVSSVRELATGLLVCDSGAHSFFAEVAEKGFSASGHRKTTKTKMTPDEYFIKYIDFVIEQKHNLDYYVELDIGEIIGQDKVEKWRKILKEKGLFNKCITCYHPSIMSLDYFDKMCKESESKYVAVEGDRPLQRVGRLDYTTLIKIARKNNCKIHGFAMTKKSALKTFPFYSVDSSSWNAIWLYGKSCLRKTDKKVGSFEKQYVSTYNGISHLFAKEVEAWNKLEDEMTTLWKIRGVIWN